MPVPKVFRRAVDPLGRLVLPVFIRRTLGIQPKDLVEMYVEGETLIFQTYTAGCLFCGGPEGITAVRLPSP
jgi:transcriptional pleiotropic regulator of transition state genes